MSMWLHVAVVKLLLIMHTVIKIACCRIVRAIHPAAVATCADP